MEFSAILKPDRAQIVCKLQAVLHLNVTLAIKLGKNLVLTHSKGQNQKLFGQNLLGGGIFRAETGLK